MKNADKNILLFASLVQNLGLKDGDLEYLIPNFNKEEYKTRLDSISFSSQQDVSVLLKELYTTGMKKGWRK